MDEGLGRETGREGGRWAEIRGRAKQKGGGRRGGKGEPRRLTKRRKEEEKSKKRIEDKSVRLQAPTCLHSAPVISKIRLMFPKCD